MPSQRILIWTNAMITNATKLARCYLTQDIADLFGKSSAFEAKELPLQNVLPDEEKGNRS